MNLYGPTECTINASAYRVDASGLAGSANVIPIGYPVDDTVFFILDKDLSPVAGHETGELYIGGVQLARGYINRPDITAAHFIEYPLPPGGGYCRLYKTGDRARWNEDGSVQFVGRTDSQVKLRGYRVELNEIRLAIENHHWVKNAVVLVKENPLTETSNLIAFVELDPNEAALMDQGNHGSHHQSKQNKLQLKAQLSNLGCREVSDSDNALSIVLPFREPTRKQRKFAFARKTYRFFKGGGFAKADLLRLLRPKRKEVEAKALNALQLGELGKLLRYFGQFESKQRLLPKYSYASPGALYATQMYLEVNDVCGIAPGIYYYHPLHHQLVLISEVAGTAKSRLKVHFVGKKSAIEPVYKNNILEVLELEVGHMVGVFEKMLPKFGLCLDGGCFAPETKAHLKCNDEDYYLGTFEILPFAGPAADDPLDVYVQAHPNGVADLPQGLYLYENGALEKLSDETILQKDVIAINQEVYERAGFGIALVSRTPQAWNSFIVLGKKLQHLQMNKLRFGLMSSGYSSKSGNDLPSALRLRRILAKCGRDAGQSYFCVGGLVSEAQTKSEGMDEDIVHMKGPAEMLKDALSSRLPHYMIPNNIVVIDQLPQTPNRKIDVGAVEKLAEAHLKNSKREIVLPSKQAEERIYNAWKKVMKVEELSVRDDFFELGGNSLMAVALLGELSSDFRCKLPMQTLFEHPTIEKLAGKLTDNAASSVSRLVPLQDKGTGEPVFCWSGLGGYTMNLKLLAKKIGVKQPFYGVQALGLNEGELPCATISEMAKRDVEEILAKQPEGPYTLWGFSFGARVAFETCYQLEQRGETVKNLVLIAPGSPKAASQGDSAEPQRPVFSNRVFVTILFSVFAGRINDARLPQCLEAATDEESFAAFICAQFDNLTEALVKRIIRIVTLTYDFRYNFEELRMRKINAPVTILKARGDDYSFIENAHGFSWLSPTVIQLTGDHYNILKEPYLNELVDRVAHLLDADEVTYTRIAGAGRQRSIRPVLAQSL